MWRPRDRSSQAVAVVLHVDGIAGEEDCAIELAKRLAGVCPGRMGGSRVRPESHVEKGAAADFAVQEVDPSARVVQDQLDARAELVLDRGPPETFLSSGRSRRVRERPTT